MASEKEVTCIICPIGCKILVRMDSSKLEVLKGYKCKKGIEYARNEALDPRRMLTTSILVINGDWPLVSVKSSKPIPKEKVFSVLEEIKRVDINAPVKSGQAILKNVADTDIDIIATKTVQHVEK
jgi:CxxC motif-containing protein